MHSTSLRLPLVASIALFLGAGHAAAQGPVLAAGAGITSIHSPDANASRVAPLLHARAAWEVSRLVQVGIEVGAHDPFGSYPDTGPLDNDSALVSAGSHPVLRTTSVLASVQIGETRALYVRTGIGISSHAFRIYTPNASGGYTPAISHEGGPSAGVAIGHGLALGGFPLQLEGVALISHGEDSTSPRWAAGVQVVHAVHLHKR